VGKYAYIAAGNAGLKIIDISNPINLKEIGFFPTTNNTRSVYVLGKYAYMAEKRRATLVAEGAALRVIDVSNPTNPMEVGYYEIPNPFYDVYSIYVSGNYAYVFGKGFFSRIMSMIDISNPEKPREVRRFEVEGSKAYISGNYAYVVGWELTVIDVSNPVNPTVGRVDIRVDIGEEVDIYVLGKYAYVVTMSFLGPSYLQVIDISNPTNLRNVLGYCEIPGKPYSVYVSGGYIYVAAENCGLIILRFRGK
jgi:hypothetical protein